MRLASPMAKTRGRSRTNGSVPGKENRYRLSVEHFVPYTEAHPKSFTYLRRNHPAHGGIVAKAKGGYHDDLCRRHWFSRVGLVGRVGAINTGHLTCGIRGGGLFGTAAYAASKGAADVCFSNRLVGVKRFQTIHGCDADVARGLVLLYGIGT
jgi:hypothetical protein